MMLKLLSIAAVCLALAACDPPPCRAYPSEDVLDGPFWLTIDPDSGCAWVRPTSSPHTQMQPRIGADGRQVCYAPRVCPKAEEKQ
jgi:hypothetical protein